MAAYKDCRLPASFNDARKDGAEIKPFLKWAGGKYRIRDKIFAELPDGSRFVEPFAGSAAIYLNTFYASALVSDVNNDVVTLYKTIQREGKAFIRYCQSFFCPENNDEERFYTLRARFNMLCDPWEKSALFLYLNRHAFNGLVRYNSKGQYNVPFGKYKKPYFPYQELINFFQKTTMTDTKFLCLDFREVFKLLRPGDVVYCDPPYVPLSKTAAFTAYAGHAFGEKDQKDLAEAASHVSHQGITVLVSNHDTEWTRTLYAEACLRRFDVGRSISCRGETRCSVPELLAIYQ